MYAYACSFAASQMWLLGRLLPLMVGEFVPNDDPHWICYLGLLSVIVLCTAFEFTSDSIETLQLSIEDYLLRLYPNSITPS